MASNVTGTGLIALKDSKPIVLRTATDSKGRVGALFDLSQDRILNGVRTTTVYSHISNSRSTECTMSSCEKDEDSILLKLRNIHQELRLSIFLEMIPALGVNNAINYSRLTDKFIRILYYRWHKDSYYLSNEEINLLRQDQSIQTADRATHVVVCENWGIDANIILQLPSDRELAKLIDYSITKLCTILKGENANVKLADKEINLLEKIVDIKVFSNIPELCEMKSLIDFYCRIDEFKTNSKVIQPYDYHLYPIQELFNESSEKRFIFHEIETKQIQKLESYLVQLLTSKQRLSKKIDQNYLNVQRHFENQFREIQEKWINFKTQYSNQISRLQKLVVDIRRKNDDESSIDRVLNNNHTKTLNSLIEELLNQLTNLEKKEYFIKDLYEKQFEYKNAMNYKVDSGDDEQVIKKKLNLRTQDVRIVCFNDTLYQENKAQWYTIQEILIKERDMNSQVQIVYVDFSYCNKTLDQMIVFPSSSEINIKQKQSTPKKSPPKLLVNEEAINILLLGESGAGKSTFINAFVNYLNFRELDDARQKPIVLIPVSFIMTSGVDFDEHQVTFGGMDTLANEDFTNFGQSVTQHCKSYIFSHTNDDNTVRKLRIIDTPGIGDVRGSTQDDINMQHVLSFISKLTHLNAVCMLMKPNSARLNAFLRSCLIQLFDLLGEDARERIIFCFTNARSTFYTPGDTGPLLKQLLSSLPMKNILFNKQNTFCFDSESFRYLVATQNGMRFDDLNVNEYKQSWNKSSDESKKFLKYILANMDSPLIMGEHQSVKDAQLRIALMVRPMLEAIRNTLRNLVLYNSGFSSLSIELKPRIIKCTSAICSKCQSEPHLIHQFWITPDSLHVFHNKCRTCNCSPDNHYPIDYQLEYSESKQSSSISDKDMITTTSNLTETCAQFICFLEKVSNSVQNDFFLDGMRRMITQEEIICQHQQSNELNKQLIDCLKLQRESYEKMKKNMLDTKENIDVKAIYEKIEQIIQLPIIKSQMKAVAEWRSFMVQYYEYRVTLV